MPRPTQWRGGCARTAVVVAVALSAAGSSSLFVAPARAADSGGASRQQLVVMLGDGVARTRPSVRGRRIESVPGRRPLTRVRTILPVLGRDQSRDGKSWVQVMLPGRPNGHTGWIRASRTGRASTGWHISVKLRSRRVTVREDGRVVRRFRAVIGTSSTPTPRGRFFIEEALSLASSAAGGPFALATSARSKVLQEFNGGPGQIALHGTNHLSDPLGSAASHGCIRLSTSAITWMARRIGAGVPLTITR